MPTSLFQHLTDSIQHWMVLPSRPEFTWQTMLPLGLLNCNCRASAGVGTTNAPIIAKQVSQRSMRASVK
jgi:hypothetical protein